jgi:hypothetical protein
MATFEHHIEKETRKWKIGSLLALGLGATAEVAALFVKDKDAKAALEVSGLLMGGGAVATSALAGTIAKDDVKTMLAGGSLHADDVKRMPSIICSKCKTKLIEINVPTTESSVTDTCCNCNTVLRYDKSYLSYGLYRRDHKNNSWIEL